MELGGIKIGERDKKRDDMGYRLTVDLCDPNNGIGALSMADLVETPMSVMRQGYAAHEEITRLRAEVERLRAEAEWQPIETAPKDGTRILVASKMGGVYLVSWWKGKRTARWDNGARPLYSTPTHWHPLPAPPENSQDSD